VDAFELDPGGPGAAGPDRAVGRRRGVEHGDRRDGGVAADGDRLAETVRKRDRRAGRRAPLGPAAHDRPPPDRDADVDAAAEAAGGDALVDTAVGPASGDQ